MSYITEIARLVREALPADEPIPENADALFLIYAVIACTKGEQTTNEDVHDAWVAWMEMRGANQDSMVPYSQLAPGTRAQDSPFAAAIRAVARERRRG